MLADKGHFRLYYRYLPLATHINRKSKSPFLRRVTLVRFVSVMKIFTKTNKYYWFCQIGGWGLYGLISLFFTYNLSVKAITTDYYIRLAIYLLGGFITTHMMRELIINLRILQKNIDRQIIHFVVISITFGLIFSLISTFVTGELEVVSAEEKKFSFFQRFLADWFGGVFLLLFWNVIYFIYHYNLRSRLQEMNNLRLQATVKDLELKTIKAHINPHFIFNALNSIRALVDENPQRARTAITQLSNILRSSMQTEKLETVSLETELNIVKDYLELETMRFEDRLRVQYDIDEDTLDQQVPPMMLQTLVENAIKHGISKQIDGGVVKVSSDFVDNIHVITISNTGHLNGRYNPDGFGIESTQSRLLLMYGKKASFNIYNLNDNTVEAKIVLPVEL